MKKALLNIDYTYDFVAEDGKLTCGAPGQVLEDYIVNVTKKFIEARDLVVFPIDLHVEGDRFHPEYSQFPAHNIVGTKGRDLYGKLQSLYEGNRDNEDVIWMDKTRFSAFAGTELDLKLRERGIDEIHLVGVCTDICILHTAIDAYNRGYKIVVHEKGVASFNQQGHNWALTHFTNTMGATVL